MNLYTPIKYYENPTHQIQLDDKTVAGLSYYKNQQEWEIPMHYAKGRKLKVSLLNEYLTICEFAVYGKHWICGDFKAQIVMPLILLTFHFYDCRLFW